MAMHSTIRQQMLFCFRDPLAIILGDRGNGNARHVVGLSVSVDVAGVVVSDVVGYTGKNKNYTCQTMHIKTIICNVNNNAIFVPICNTCSIYTYLVLWFGKSLVLLLAEHCHCKVPNHNSIRG